MKSGFFTLQHVEHKLRGKLYTFDIYESNGGFIDTITFTEPRKPYHFAVSRLKEIAKDKLGVSLI